MEQLLGRPPEAALELLGTPRLDKREGQARQLQFANGCILDVWYYPGAGTPMVATHADARLPDGRDFAAGDCLQMLIRARAPAVTPPPPAQPPARKPPARKKP